jgi:D-hydroxyproline dehydrogenase subunit gamma
MTAAGRIVRLVEGDRAPVRFLLDGAELGALEGDTVLTAILASTRAVRTSEFGSEPRAGFCLMGACQDCWVWQEEGPRLRACSTFVTEGMRLRTMPPENWP